MLELQVSFGSDFYLPLDKRTLIVAHNLLSQTWHCEFCAKEKSILKAASFTYQEKDSFLDCIEVKP